MEDFESIFDPNIMELDLPFPVLQASVPTDPPPVGNAGLGHDL